MTLVAGGLEGRGLCPAAGVSTFLLRFSGLARLALSPLGERVDRRRRSLQPGRAG